MYLINYMPPQVDREFLELLAQCRTETIGHHRHWGFVHGDIKAVMGERAIIGTAVTVLCPGHDHHACWGGGTTLAAQVTGAVGVVIDGRATGTSEFREYDLPAWIREYSPVGGLPYSIGGGRQHSGLDRWRRGAAEVCRTRRRKRSSGAAARRRPLPRRNGD